MKKRLIILLLAGCMVLSGCAAKENLESQQDNSAEEKEEFHIEVESKIEQEKCFLCGEADDSLMGYYSQKESIGIVHLNSLYISETRVRDFDDDGNELFQQGGSSTLIIKHFITNLFSTFHAE